MTGTAIFWPALLIIAVTLVLYFLMARVRFALVRSGEAKAAEFKTYENEHNDSRKWSRAVANQFELPVIFYALCLMAFVTGNADTVMLILAWGFALIKTVHVYLHVTANRIRIRQPVFALSYVFLILMFIWFTIKLAIA